ncbi:uncharacterized protein FIBRA_01171 [Fibroporia radiculosa]|uniref:EF-hand domain-containing protein n=1 Tax=Fibroporia radiculosa TaxID=599839 RepID=J4I8C2_9APHY|nr:uncharacterized protein FIBRA_01171 [Fibroporia radiculosa]CCL99156.1 predicted protein [Fibroporia radiculosa]
MSVHSSHSGHHHHHHHHHSHHSHHDPARAPSYGARSVSSSSSIYSGHGDRSFSPAISPLPPPPPPNGADPQLWRWFSAVNTNHSGAISVKELQNALVNGDWSKFDLDTVKMLMNMFDVDRSGSIGFNGARLVPPHARVHQPSDRKPAEFCGLWKYIQDWQKVFKHFDRDRSGTIEGYELAEALGSFGYNLPPTILTLIEQKYASGPAPGNGPPPGISFDRFVRACVVVKALTEAFHRVDTDRDGWVQLNYEDFMKIVLSAP